MSDDFPRFNVMPKRPLSVEDTGENNEWWSGRLGYLPKDHWHEVSEPIVWDGSDEAYDAIEAFLRPLGVTILLDDIDADELDEPMPALQLRNVSSTFPTVGFIPPMARIRREGDSFVILPPEVKS